MFCCRIQCSRLTTSRTVLHTQHEIWRGKFDGWAGRLWHRSVNVGAWIERAIHLVQLPWGVCGMGWFIWHGGIFWVATEKMAVHGLRDMIVGFIA